MEELRTETPLARSQDFSSSYQLSIHHSITPREKRNLSRRLYSILHMKVLQNGSGFLGVTHLHNRFIHSRPRLRKLYQHPWELSEDLSRLDGFQSPQEIGMSINDAAGFTKWTGKTLIKSPQRKLKQSPLPRGETALLWRQNQSQWSQLELEASQPEIRTLTPGQVDLLLHLPSSPKINKDCVFSQAKLKAKCKNTACSSAGHTNLIYIHMNEVLVHDHELRPWTKF